MRDQSLKENIVRDPPHDPLDGWPVKPVRGPKVYCVRSGSARREAGRYNASVRVLPMHRLNRIVRGATRHTMTPPDTNAEQIGTPPPDRRLRPLAGVVGGRCTHEL